MLRRWIGYPNPRQARLEREAAENKPPPSLIKSLWVDRYFFLAVLISASFLAYPDTQWVLWPLKQFSVYVHELFHGLAAIVSGGEFRRMMFHPDGGGLAITISYGPFNRAIISAGGLIGPALLGGFILFFSRRYHMTRLLLHTLAVLFASNLLFWIRDWPTALFCLSAMAALIGLSLIPFDSVVRTITQFIALHLCLENLIDFRYMFTEGFERDGEIQLSDTANIAEAIGGTYAIWGTLIAGLTLFIIGFRCSNRDRGVRAHGEFPQSAEPQHAFW